MFHLNKLHTPKKRIYKWILETIADGSWQRHNDLHIDMIDEAHERNRRNWLKMSLKYHQIAKNFLHENKMPFCVDLYIDLWFKEGNGNCLPKTYSELLNDLTDSPPSLYLWDNRVSKTPNELYVKQPLQGILKLPIGTSATYGHYYNAEGDETNRYIYIQ